jgi:ADP-heptose:LPS heptosyltransferase
MSINKESVKRIVVFAPNKPFFGANILQLPFFQHLRANFPDARIILWSTVKTSEMIINLHLADELHYYRRGMKDYPKILRFLRSEKIDIAFNLRWASEGINLMTGLSGAKLRIGFKESGVFSWLLNRRVPMEKQNYMSLRYLDLLKPAGVGALFFFEEMEKLDTNATIQLPEDKSLVCLMPAGGEGEHKRWGIDNFCRLATLMLKAKPNAYFYFVIGPAEKDYIGIIEQSLPLGSYHILAGGSLADIVRISKGALLTVANDCGPSHLAQMSGSNYIGVWGWGMQHAQQRIINWTAVRPNSLHVVAPLGEDIKTVKPSEVLRVAMGFLMEK